MDALAMGLDVITFRTWMLYRMGVGVDVVAVGARMLWQWDGVGVQ